MVIALPGDCRWREHREWIEGYPRLNQTNPFRIVQTRHTTM